MGKQWQIQKSRGLNSVISDFKRLLMQEHTVLRSKLGRELTKLKTHSSDYALKRLQGAQ